jgi:hypothetical protein
LYTAVIGDLKPKHRRVAVGHNKQRPIHSCSAKDSVNFKVTFNRNSDTEINMFVLNNTLESPEPVFVNVLRSPEIDSQPRLEIDFWAYDNTI